MSQLGSARPFFSKRDAGFLGAFMHFLASRWTKSRQVLSDLPLWCPIAFAIGASVYFTLPGEPPPDLPIILTALAVAALILAGIFRRCQYALVILLLAAFALGGFIHGQNRTHARQTPIVPDTERASEVTGWIESVQRSTSRERLIIRVIGISGMDEAPKRVRVLAGRGTFRPGDAVQFRAVLGPPPRPASPGSYDSGFAAYFSGIGGTGFAVTNLIGIEYTQERRARGFAQWRWGIAERIRTRASPDTAGIAAALLTGDRSGISPEHAEALRATGLGHILAISGLHMALFAGGIFFAIRAVFAAIEPFARRFDPRIPAAVGALLAAFAYLVISGAAIPTQRAFIMTAAILLGVLFSRRALSMRSVGFAAFLVLLFQPESIVTPGFQMSFAATAALIAAFQLARNYQPASPSRGWLLRYGNGFLAIAYSSLIAGLATAGFAAFHFNRLAAFGLIANLAVMPVFSLIVMPAGVMALILMPVGLEGPPLYVMGLGLDWVIWISSSISQWPGALTPVIAGPGLSLPIYSSGFVALVAGRGLVRFVGAAIMLLGIMVWTFSTPPDGLITDSGVVIARYDRLDGEWGSSATRRSRFAARVFMERSGNRGARIAQGMMCDTHGCAGGINGLTIAVPDDDEALVEDCQIVDLVVTRLNVNRAMRARCPAELIDAVDLSDSGARSFWIENGVITRWQSVADVRGDRPWTWSEWPSDNAE